MSRRVMEALSTFTPEVEVYSIVEVFLTLETVSDDAETDRRATARGAAR